MSIESLLDELTVPLKPSVNIARKPLKIAANKYSSLGSPSSIEKTASFDNEIINACHNLDITPAEIISTLSSQDIDDWNNGDMSTETLRAFARSLVQRREMNQGKVPASYTERATCKNCGPIWLWFSGEVHGCPWCWNRAKGRPVPRP